MNTLEKRKLEGIVLSKLATARETVTAQREAERKALIQKCEDNVPDAVQKLAATYAELSKKREKVEEQVKDLGYVVKYANGVDISLAQRSEYVGGSWKYDYSEPSILAHQTDTKKRLQALDDLGTQYSVKIWAEGEDMSKLLKSFAQDLKALA